MVAAEEARNFQHRYVGTGHLAVAALRAGATEKGENAHLPSPDVARDRLLRLLGRGTLEAGVAPALTPRAVRLVAACEGNPGHVADDILAHIRIVDASLAARILSPSSTISRRSVP
jgi:hypothetical protein